MNLCLFGASSADIDTLYVDAVRELGRNIAGRGHTLVFGGGATGLMGAAVRGVREGRGNVTGIAPKFFDKPGILYEQCSEFIFTDTMRQRKHIMEERSDAFIMVPGGIGTFEEFFEVLVLKQLNQLDKPIAIFNPGDYFASLMQMLSHAVRHGFMENRCMRLFGIFKDIGELLDYIEEEYSYK